MCQSGSRASLRRCRFFAGGFEEVEETGMATESDSDREEWVVLWAARGWLLAAARLVDEGGILGGVGRVYAPSRLAPFKRELAARYPLVD